MNITVRPCKRFTGIEIYKSGGKLPIDNLCFIDPILDREKAGEYEFYLAGARTLSGM